MKKIVLKKKKKYSLLNRIIDFPGGSDGKAYLPAIQETQVQSLCWEDPLEKGMATHSSIFAWRISWTRGAWQATVHGVAELDTTE